MSVRWIITGIFPLLLSKSYRVCGQNFDISTQPDYYDDPSMPSPLYNLLNFTAPICNTSIPESPQTVNYSSGHYLYLVLDPKTQKLSVQIIPTCNQTNAIDISGGLSGNATIPKNNLTENSTSPGTCTILSLKKSVVDTAAYFFRTVLNNKLDDFVDLCTELSDNAATSFLDDFTNDFESLVNETLSEKFEDIENSMNVTNATQVSGLQTQVEQLCRDQLSNLMAPDSLNELITNINQTLNDTMYEFSYNMEIQVKNVYDISADNSAFSGLTENATAQVNSTFQNLLNDASGLMLNLLNNLMGNDSLTTNFTSNVESLLTSKLNDTICDLQKLFNDTDSLSSLITNLENLFTDTLNDELQGVGSTMKDLLQDFIGKPDVPDTLAQDSVKLMTNHLALLLRQKVSYIQRTMPDFRRDMLSNITSSLNGLFSGAELLPNIGTTPTIPLASYDNASAIPSVPYGNESAIPSVPNGNASGIPSIPYGNESAVPSVPYGNASAIPSIPYENATAIPSVPYGNVPINPSIPNGNASVIPSIPSTLIPDILRLINRAVDDMSSAFDQLSINLTSSDTMDEESMSSLTEALQNIFQNMSQNLLGSLQGHITQNITNATNLAQLQSSINPFGQVVTDILKEIYQCNVTCTPSNSTSNSTINSTTSSPTNSTAQPVLSIPCVLPIPPAELPPNSSIPFSNVDYSSNIADFLERFQENLFSDFDSNYDSSDLANTNLRLPDLPFDDFTELVALPNRMLSGVGKSVEFTNNVAVNDLMGLVNIVTKGTNLSNYE